MSTEVCEMVRAAKKRYRTGYELTEEEYWELFDEEARSRLGMTGAEFIARYDAGEIDVDEPATHSAATHLEAMLPAIRRIIARM